jgi:hypothetical protein
VIANASNLIDRTAEPAFQLGKSSMADDVSGYVRTSVRHFDRGALMDGSKSTRRNSTTLDHGPELCDFS